MNPQYLSVTQVADLKQVSRNAVYKAVSQGRLPATKIGGFVVIRTLDARNWTPKIRTGRRRGVKVSDETKAKIAQAQRLRWKKRKEQPE